MDDPIKNWCNCILSECKKEKKTREGRRTGQITKLDKLEGKKKLTTNGAIRRDIKTWLS